MHRIEDIPSIQEQGQRIEEITVDCYNQAEELAGFEVYFADAMQFPFAATWRDPDEAGHVEPVTALGVDSVDLLPRRADELWTWQLPSYRVDGFVRWFPIHGCTILFLSRSQASAC